MIEPDPEWQHLTTRPAARVLQGFTCTTDCPRTPGGRTLPHDRPWEWEAQRYLRQASHLLRPGDLLLVGVRTDVVVAAAHLQFDTSGDILQVFIAAVGVAVAERRQGGALADRMLAAVYAEGVARATDDDCGHLVLTGKIHTSNTASQRMVQRAGWEPYDMPSSIYQSWGRLVAI